ncbi:phytoene/squalene synthase family protein [Radiobacillus sp. PE A8.2]|uniref:phytoene/squalene synthase family protein n=1 Tax=Radiobacillus sp. PE A8.2 TaxID=3380349 RepID=UPI00388D4372
MLNRSFSLACEQMMKENSSSFYHAFKFLPSPRKEAVYIIYSFCRMIDDAVDEPDRSPYTLDELEDHFNHLEEAEGHFVWPALRWLFEQFPISKQPYYTQMSGQRLDYVQTSYETLGQLEDYCYRVAGSVGEMLIPVLHDRADEKIVQSGVALGKAMQIVNIIRDIGADQQLERRYVPSELLNKYNYQQQDFDAQLVNDSFRRIVNDLIEVADDWFREGLEMLDTYPKKSGLSIKLAANYYREIVQVVQENDYQVFTKRAVVTNQRKSKLFLQLTQ